MCPNWEFVTEKETSIYLEVNQPLKPQVEPSLQSLTENVLYRFLHKWRHFFLFLIFIPSEWQTSRNLITVILEYCCLTWLWKMCCVTHTTVKLLICFLFYLSSLYGSFASHHHSMDIHRQRIMYIKTSMYWCKSDEVWKPDIPICFAVLMYWCKSANVWKPDIPICFVVLMYWCKSAKVWKPDIPICFCCINVLM